jgi:hypothetical protein
LVATWLIPGVAMAGNPGDGSVKETPPPYQPNLLVTLTGLSAGPDLDVVRAENQLAIIERSRKRVLLVAGPQGLLQMGPKDAPRSTRDQAATEVIRSPKGERVYSFSISKLGAHLTTVAAGQLNRGGLHVIAFDNDDLHISDGSGGLIFSRQLTPDGTLTESEGVGYGCGCERVTGPDGAVVVKPIDGGSGDTIERRRSKPE